MQPYGLVIDMWMKVVRGVTIKTLFHSNLTFATSAHAYKEKEQKKLFDVLESHKTSITCKVMSW